ncbi:collagen alpha-1(I) chain-like [Accipiter gentilis]|uniref:collagen alpha-1(I) chain-like n=1 Tax=Astur gentilis TaxID=8957 RepID=UPI00211004F0|nr:collagen alpha-1(I) chain-like [Accipiter gentilis]
MSASGLSGPPRGRAPGSPLVSRCEGASPAASFATKPGGYCLSRGRAWGRRGEHACPSAAEPGAAAGREGAGSNPTAGTIDPRTAAGLFPAASRTLCSGIPARGSFRVDVFDIEFRPGQGFPGASGGAGAQGWRGEAACPCGHGSGPADPGRAPGTAAGSSPGSGGAVEGTRRCRTQRQRGGGSEKERCAPATLRSPRSLPPSPSSSCRATPPPRSGCPALLSLLRGSGWSRRDSARSAAGHAPRSLRAGGSPPGQPALGGGEGAVLKDSSGPADRSGRAPSAALRRDRAGALGTGPRCAGAGGPHGPGPRSPPPPRRRTWERGRSRDPRPPPAPSHRHRPAPLRAPRTQQPRVVAGWVHAGPSHAGPAPVSGPLSPGERARSAVASLPSRRAGDAGPVASLRPPHGYRKRPDGREGEHTPCRREWSAPGPGSPGTASFSPARSRWRCRAPRGTSPNALAGSPRGRRRAVRGPRQVGRPVGADSPVSPAGRAARGREAAGTSRGAVPVAAGTGGRDGGCPDGAGRSPSTRAGTDERRRQRPTGGHSGWLASDIGTRTAGTRHTAAACGSTREGGPPRRSPLPRTLLGSGCPAGRYPEVSVCGGVRARLPVKRSSCSPKRDGCGYGAISDRKPRTGAGGGAAPDRDPHPPGPPSRFSPWHLLPVVPLQEQGGGEHFGSPPLTGGGTSRGPRRMAEPRTEGMPGRFSATAPPVIASPLWFSVGQHAVPAAPVEVPRPARTERC